MTNDPIPQSGAVTPVIDNPGAPPAPAVPPVQAPPITPAPAAPPQTFQEGGLPKKGFFADITLTDVIVGTLVIASLGLAVFYFREKIKQNKGEFPEIRSKVDKLEEEVKEMKSDPQLPNQFG